MVGVNYLLADKGQDRRPYLRVEIYGVELLGLLDSGASRSIVGGPGWDLLNPLKCKLLKVDVPEVTVANGEGVAVLGSVTAPVRVEKVVKVMELLVIPGLKHCLILGADFWEKFEIVPNLCVRQWEFHQPIAPIESVSKLNSLQKITLSRLIDKVFEDMGDGLGCTSLVEHVIRTTSDSIKQRYYPVSPAVQANINKEVDEMLALGVIEPSTSPWSSPILLVRKKDGKFRFCVDFRKLNSVTEKDAYPIPYVSATLDKLRNAKFLSSLDIKSAYWQIPMAESSKKFTAFTIPGKGLYQFRRMPFGLHNAPATWQRFIDAVLGPDLEPNVFVYLDDVIIVTDTFEQHVKVLEEVLGRIRKAGLKLSKDKCEFCKAELRYLGYVVSNRGLSVDPEKVKGMVEYPRPNSVTGVRRFVGMVSWYRRFVPNFSDVIAPITELLKKGRKLVWGEKCEEAFVRLKDKLVSAPILTCPNFELPFVIHTDASGFGIGAVLTQNDPKEGEQVISYLSRTLTRTERNYSTTERECLAVLWAIEKLRPYIEGGAFTVVTDHHSLVWLNNLKDPQGRLARWAVKLQQHDFKIIHRKGKEHLVPDALSRANEGVAEVVAREERGTSSSVDKWHQKMLAVVVGNPKQYPDWKVEEGKLFKYVRSKYPRLSSKSEQWKEVPTKEARLGILKENHDSIMAGHGGVQKTCDRVLNNYFWPKLKLQVAKYVRGCKVCQSTKPDLRQPPGYMCTRTKVSQPWEMLCIDLIGPLPRSSRGYKYILTVVDYFSKFPLYLPLRTPTAKAVTTLLEEQVLLIFGVPKWIVCDNGVQFKSKEFASLAREYGITINFTAFYHPQANPAERFNQTLKTKIRAYISDNHREWDLLLPKISCAIRSSTHEVLKTTPFFVLFGRDIRLKGNNESLSPEGFQVERPDRSDLRDRSKALGEVIKDVRSKILGAGETSSKRYNLRRRAVEFFPKDTVLRRNFVLSDAAKYFNAKLAPKYIGPFEIKAKVSPWTYELVGKDGKTGGIWNVKDLKLFEDTRELI